jgi:hypothetical protein
VIDFSFFYPELNNLNLKENGTIPFYCRFLEIVFIREFRQMARTSVVSVTSVTVDDRHHGPNYLMLVGRALTSRPNFNPLSVTPAHISLSLSKKCAKVLGKLRDTAKIRAVRRSRSQNRI